MKIQFDFSDKRVLVTGSTMGIGRAAAKAFHDLGAIVAINGRTPESVAKAIAELGGGTRLIAAPGDLSTTTAISAVVGELLGRWGGLDVLVNNAGRGDDCLVGDVTGEGPQKLPAPIGEVASVPKGRFGPTVICVASTIEATFV